MKRAQDVRWPEHWIDTLIIGGSHQLILLRGSRRCIFAEGRKCN